MSRFRAGALAAAAALSALAAACEAPYHHTATDIAEEIRWPCGPEPECESRCKEQRVGEACWIAARFGGAQDAAEYAVLGCRYGVEPACDRVRAFARGSCQARDDDAFPSPCQKGVDALLSLCEGTEASRRCRDAQMLAADLALHDCTRRLDAGGRSSCAPASLASLCSGLLASPGACAGYAAIAQVVCERLDEARCRDIVTPLDLGCRGGSEQACEDETRALAAGAARVCSVLAECKVACERGNAEACIESARIYEMPGFHGDDGVQGKAIYLGKACRMTRGRRGCEELCKGGYADGCEALVASGRDDAHARDVAARERFTAALRGDARVDDACATFEGCEKACGAGAYAACLRHAESFTDGRYAVQSGERALAVYDEVCAATGGALGCYEAAKLVGPTCFAGDDGEGFTSCVEAHPITPAVLERWAAYLVAACEGNPLGFRGWRACADVAEHARWGPRAPSLVKEADHLCKDHIDTCGPE